MPGRIQSIERAAAILRLLSGRSRRLGVAELAGELRLPKGTVYGILRTLQAVGFVEQDRESGKYQLGPALLHMGSSYLDGNELRTRALNWADGLATRSGESVLDLFKDLNNTGQTIILVTHDPRLAERYADRIVTLVDGAVARDAVALEAVR